MIVFISIIVLVEIAKMIFLFVMIVDSVLTAFQVMSCA